MEYLEALNNPEDSSSGTHKMPFSRELYIEKEDFLENPPDKFYRLSPGQEVRLRYGYFITCVGVDRDKNSGEILAVRCTYDPETKGGQAPDRRKVKGTIHWVSAPHSIEAEVRLYEHLFMVEKPEEIEDYRTVLNPNSLIIVHSARLEPYLEKAVAGKYYQFERIGYFCVDSIDSKIGAPVFNRTVSLRDSWSKIRNRTSD
jgi:glutaminyl-tRNA synthetase